MAYYNSNAARAYDMQDEAYEPYGAYAPAAPREEVRPRLDVLTGAGREANQGVSPLFTTVAKVAVAMVLVLFAVGAVRVALGSMTTVALNANAEMTTAISEAHQEASDLEVKRSVYGSRARIRDLAADTLGMVEAEGGVTLDLS